MLFFVFKSNAGNSHQGGNNAGPGSRDRVSGLPGRFFDVLAAIVQLFHRYCFAFYGVADYGFSFFRCLFPRIPQVNLVVPPLWSDVRFIAFLLQDIRRMVSGSLS